jgi:succinoglycan biosynthesis protein ExoA
MVRDVLLHEYLFQEQRYHSIESDFEMSIVLPRGLMYMERKEECSQSAEKSDLPVLTIVLPVLNEDAHIEGILTQLLAQEYPMNKLEIIVADGGSRDSTCQIVRAMGERYPQVRLIANPGKRSSSGRNVGFLNGRGEYYIVVDAHCRIDNPKLLATMVEAFMQTGAMALGRPQPLLCGDQSMTATAIVLARSSVIGHNLRSFIYTSGKRNAIPVKESIVSTGAMYRRAVFDKVGLVDESFDACEDVEFNYRVEAAGLSTYFVPSLAIMYYARTSFGALWRQMVRYGMGRARLIRKHPDAAGLETFVPAGFVLFVTLVPIMAVFDETVLRLWGILLSFYVVILFVAAMNASMKRERWLIVPLIVTSYFVIHMGLGVGFLVGMAESWHGRVMRWWYGNQNYYEVS